MPDHDDFASLIWQIADLLRGTYSPPQYERVVLTFPSCGTGRTADLQGSLRSHWASRRGIPAPMRAPCSENGFERILFPGGRCP